MNGKVVDLIDADALRAKFSSITVCGLPEDKSALVSDAVNGLVKRILDDPTIRFGYEPIQEESVEEVSIFETIRELRRRRDYHNIEPGYVELTQEQMDKLTAEVKQQETDPDIEVKEGCYCFGIEIRLKGEEKES